jgi:glycosyltransferase involved in cell wall biosynthesis
MTERPVLRIAQVAPLPASLPPTRACRAAELVESLADELVRRGHEVTVFRGANSGHRDETTCWEHRDLDRIFDTAREFDLVHSHLDHLVLCLESHTSAPILTTLHDRLDRLSSEPLYWSARRHPHVSVSYAQRAPAHFLNWRKTVLPGIRLEGLRFQEHRGSYLAFAGRIDPWSDAPLAIEIGERAGVPIRLAAVEQQPTEEYFESAIRPLLSGSRVDYLGVLSADERAELLAGALALVVPSDPPAPFDLVGLEALACGTPLVCRGYGALQEALEAEEVALLIADSGEAIHALEWAQAVSRERCRAVVEQRFTAARMAEDYNDVYRALTRRH